jgi:multidrug efflux system outer membrane protein
MPETSHQRASDPFKSIGTIVFMMALEFLMIACNVGPNYKRPTVDIPRDFRGRMAPEIAPASSSPSIADERWTSIFGDPVLEGLIREALTNNLDLRIAAQRILEMQAEVGIARSQQFPSIEAGGRAAGVQLPSSLASEHGGIINKSFLAGGGPGLSSLWNLDFWGLYRRQTEAARAELLASEWAQKEIRSTLVESVAGAYFDLRGLDAQLAITEKTIAARKESLQLTQALEQHGAGSLADVRQAEELLHTAQANIPVLRRQIAIEENSISVLMGHMPEAIGRGLPIQEEPHPLQVPTGIPSELLERRPDIQEAEAKLIAANARIGVARAQFFPQISLTSAGGVSSNQLSSLFTGGSTYWYAIGSISQPLFEGGRIRSNYRLSQEQKQEMVVRYQKTILDAFRDVSDALVSYKEIREYREEQAADVTAATDAVRLARLRYAGGNASYLEVLTTDTDLYSAQLVLARAEQQEAASLVQLYAGLGGGWQ